MSDLVATEYILLVLGGPVKRCKCAAAVFEHYGQRFVQ